MIGRTKWNPLRRSLSWRVVGDILEFGYGAKNDNAPKYAKFLEFGTRNMEPRPTLDNAITATQRNAETAFTRFIVKELNS